MGQPSYGDRVGSLWGITPTRSNGETMMPFVKEVKLKLLMTLMHWKSEQSNMGLLLDKRSPM